MLPITRVNLQNFCRACLSELSMELSKQNSFPEKVCSKCNIKIIAFKEFQRKAIFSTGILRLITDEKSIQEDSLKRLLKYCRICLRRNSNEQNNIRNSKELCIGIAKCTGIQFISKLEDDIKHVKEDAIKDDLSFPGALCNRCFATLKSFLDFKILTKQTTNYLKSILNENNETDFKEEYFTHLELETEPFPLDESSQELSTHSESVAENALNSENFNFAEITILSLVNNNYNEDKEVLPAISTTRKSKPKLYCPKCNASFRKQYLLEAHIKSVHDVVENAFSCPHCEQSFANSKALQRHVSSKHENNRNPKHICNYCDRAFKRNTRLKEHISTVHQKQKPFSCSLCSKAFGTKNILIRHQKNHSNEKPFSCEYCGKRYNLKSDLTVHIQRHTANPNLLCPICKRAQADEKELKAHIDRHAKSYQCQECGKIFKKMVNLREHVDTVHLKQKFKCILCNLEFSARKSLKNHELGHQSTQWPEFCADCKLYFKSKHSLLIHLKKWHPKPQLSISEDCEKCLLCFCSFKTKDSLKEHMEKLHPFGCKNK